MNGNNMFIPSSEPCYQLLVVDDSKMNRMLVRAALPEKLFVITQAIDGYEAIKAVTEHEFDVMLLDISMPGMDGVEVCRYIRQQLGETILPIIMLTALGDTELVASFEAGANDYLSKPFDQMEIIARLSAAARHKQLEDAQHYSNQALETTVFERTTELNHINGQLKVSSARVQAILDNAFDAIIVFDRSAMILSANRAACDQFGYHEEELLGHSMNLLLSHGFYQALQLDIDDYLKGGQTEIVGAKPCETEGVCKDSSRFSIDLAVSRMQLQAEQQFVCIIRDITDRKSYEERITYLANFDELTGLPNRNLLYDRFTHAMAQSERNGYLLALYSLKIKGCKEVNDSLGYQKGNALIQQLATRLSEGLRHTDMVVRPASDDRDRDTDTVARLNGSTFAILAEGHQSENSVALMAQKILMLFKMPFELDGLKFYLACDMGISVYPNDGAEVDQLFSSAEIAMHRAAKDGGGSYQFYTRDMNAAALERCALDVSLHQALENREFVLYYQPKVDAKTGKLVGVESLVRWLHPVDGLIPPFKFIPMLEETGLIVGVGEWILREACEQNIRWQKMGYPAINMAINLSARQFDDPDLIHKVNILCDEGLLQPGRIELEVTESAVMGNVDESIAVLKQLQAMEALIALDDFGTGHSSLAYLMHFPIHTLKIDKTFVDHIATDASSLAIARTIIAMAKTLNMSVVAEGVEDEDQFRILAEENCDIIQGYYFSRPLPADELTALLEKGGQFEV
ncbi:MAG: EAL domain-containing protein [Mariprofundus sp.]|nr:EAL domain-containing protein [Mariprofundus sp.]